MRKVGAVAVVLAVLLLGACEDGPGVGREPEPHAIEGTWEMVEFRFRVMGYVESEGRDYDQEHPLPISVAMLGATEIQFTFKEGVYTLRTKRQADAPWTKTDGLYLIDEESDRVVVLMEYAGGSDVSHVYRYKLSGSAGLDLRMQIGTDEPIPFPRKTDRPWVLIIEGTEVSTSRMEFVFIFERV